jgi:hypothetical protein
MLVPGGDRTRARALTKGRDAQHVVGNHDRTGLAASRDVRSLQSDQMAGSTMARSDLA